MQQNKNDSLDEEDFITSESSDINNSKEEIIYKSDEPSIIIEKILISIYNKNIIKSDNSEKDDLDINLYQNNIRNLCFKYDYCYIVLLLLKNILKLMNKYREIIFEFTDLKSKDCSYSPNNKKVNIPKYKNYFQIESNNDHKSYQNIKQN